MKAQKHRTLILLGWVSFHNATQPCGLGRARLRETESCRQSDLCCNRFEGPLVFHDCLFFWFRKVCVPMMSPFSQEAFYDQQPHLAGKMFSSWDSRFQSRGLQRNGVVPFFEGGCELTSQCYLARWSKLRALVGIQLVWAASLAGPKDLAICLTTLLSSQHVLLLHSTLCKQYIYI